MPEQAGHTQAAFSAAPRTAAATQGQNDMTEPLGAHGNWPFPCCQEVPLHPARARYRGSAWHPAVRRLRISRRSMADARIDQRNLVAASHQEAADRKCNAPIRIQMISMACPCIGNAWPTEDFIGNLDTVPSQQGVISMSPTRRVPAMSCARVILSANRYTARSIPSGSSVIPRQCFRREGGGACHTGSKPLVRRGQRCVKEQDDGSVSA